jgi:hypothetical protein
MPTTTPRLGLTKPVVGAEDDIWGPMLNGNADTLDTVTAKDSDLTAHKSDKANPHVVTAAQVGALTPAAAATIYAPIASPVFTGDPQAPTPGAADNDTSIATTAFVKTAVAGLAPLASPVFTGNPTAPTAAPGDNDTTAPYYRERC